MPFKSKAQRRKFAKLVEEGKISKKTFDEWDKDTPEDIPEHTTPKFHAKIRQPRRLKR